MNDRLLGMYIHMHWGYNYPYAARTWRIEDWSAYLDGLKAMGYNLVQIWPMVDTMPLPLTASDRAHLQKLERVIDMAHERGMTVYVGASANAMGNERAADYAFADRPYFTAERLVDPGDEAQVRQLVEARRVLLEPLAQADGFWIIDSDPGGYAGSSVGEFVRLFEEHRALLDSLRPGILLLYWMWVGWTGGLDLRAGSPERSLKCLRGALEGLMALDPEPWGILACSPEHFAIVEDLGLTSRALYYPYGTIEDEPSFPWTNYDPDRVYAAFERVSPDRYPMGVMGNAQSHCLQLPHIYLFRHFAGGGMKGGIDLRGLGEDLLPGFGDALATAWEAMGGQDLAALQRARAALDEISVGARIAQGRLCGLYFGQVDRLVGDLEAQIEVAIALLRIREQIAGGDKGTALQDLVRPLQAWWERHGFVDRYLGTFKDLLHPILKEVAERIAEGEQEALTPRPSLLPPDFGGEPRGGLGEGEQLLRALHDFDAGAPHGAFVRLFETLKGIGG